MSSAEPTPPPDSSVSAERVALARYRLHRPLGEGGMGVVYQATDRLTGRDVALKSLVFAPASLNQGDAETGHDRRARIGLIREFTTLATLHHPNIIGVGDYGFDPRGKPYFVMELVEGARSLTAAAFEQPRAVQVALLADALGALAYIHRRGIIHRDLKPANLLVGGDGEVKVLDFGLSINPDVRTSGGHHNALSGTIAYMAPELFSDAPPSPASDLFALGIMAYEIFAGRYPFGGNHRLAGQVIAAILTQTPDFTPFPPALAEVLMRLLDKAPDARYSDADNVMRDLCRATDQPLPSEREAVRESFLQASTFVGRAAELSELTTALGATARDRAGALWLVGGESGVGKSRLLEELRIRAAVEGVLVLRGGATTEARGPFEIWREPLRVLALEIALTDFEVGVLAAIAPDLSALVGRRVDPPPALDERGTLRRLANTLVDVLTRVAQPTLLILEDLQWAAASDPTLQALSSALEARPLMIVGTYRSDERPELPAQFPGARTLMLERLIPPHIAQLTASMLGSAGSNPELLALVQQETEGNTLFIIEVVRALAEAAGSLRDIGTVTLPAQIFAGGMREVIGRRLRRVPADAYTLLRQAALIGREPDLSVLARLTSAPLDEWLRACANAAVLELADGRWRFAHDKLREALLEGLMPDERRELSRAIAGAFEAVYPIETLHSTLALALYDHWRAADDLAKIVEYAPQAARQWYNIGRMRETLASTQAGLEALDALETGTPSDNPPQQDRVLARCDLNRWAQVASGDLGDYAASEAYAQTALALARGAELRELERRILQGLGNVKMMTGDYPATIDYARQVLALAEADGDLLGQASSTINIGIALGTQGDFARADDYFLRGLEISRQADSPRTAATAFNSLGVNAHLAGNYQAARQHYEAALAIRRQLGDRQSEALVLANLSGALDLLGEYDTAHAYNLAALRVRQQLGDRRGIVHSYNNLGWNMFRRLNLVEAAEYQRLGLAEAETLGDRRQLGLCHRDLAWVQIMLGDFEPATAHTEAALSLFRETDDRANAIKCDWNYGVIAFRCDQPEAALRHFETALDTCQRENLSGFIFDAHSYVVMALAALHRGEALRPHLVAMTARINAQSTPASRLALLVCAGSWWVTTGGDPARAAEHWALVDAHPLKDGDHEFLLLPALRDQLDRALPFELLHPAFERGRALDFATQVDEVVVSFTEAGS